MLSGRFGSSPDSVGLGGWLGRLARSRVRTVLAGVVVLAALAVPPSASAHLRSGTVAIDYRARVFDAGTSAYSAQIFQSDRALSLTLEPGHVVVLVGYLGEPVSGDSRRGDGRWCGTTRVCSVFRRACAAAYGVFR